MGVAETEVMTQEEYRKAVVDAVKQLSEDVEISKDLKEIEKKEDIPFLEQSAYDDVCHPATRRKPVWKILLHCINLCSKEYCRDRHTTRDR